MTSQEWAREIKVGAARGFGAKHYKAILGFAVARRVAPWLLVLGGLGAAAYAAIGAARFTIGVVLVALGTMLLLVIAWRAWKAFSFLITDYVPIPAPVVGALAFLVLAGAGSLTLYLVIR